MSSFKKKPLSSSFEKVEGAPMNRLLRVRIGGWGEIIKSGRNDLYFLEQMVVCVYP
jgi:hypothetical protein